MYSHGPASTRFSPLDQINAGNVAGLKRMWTFHMTPADAPKAAPTNSILARLRVRRSETTPLMVHGVLYLPTPYNRVIALAAASGKPIWEYKVPNNANASTRGVAYWPGDAKVAPRIVFGTSDGSLIALEAKTGKILWDTVMEAGAYDTPITYRAANGKQYVVIVATGGGYYDRTGGDSVATYALP